MDIPIFDQNALASLTQKIETNFKTPTSGNAQPKSNTKSRKDRLNSGTQRETRPTEPVPQHGGKKRSRDGQLKRSAITLEVKPLDSKAEVSSASRGIPKQKKTSHREAEADPTLAAKLRIKDDRHSYKAHIQKPEQGGKTRQTSSRLDASTAVKRNDSEAGIKSRRTLHDDILALGGTEEDIELIEDVDSESELEGPGSKPMNGKLLKDLRKLVQDLGVQEAGRDDDKVSAEGNEYLDEELPNSNVMTPKPRKDTTEIAALTSKNNRIAVSKLKFEPRAEWHSAELPLLPAVPQQSSIPKFRVDSLHKYAIELLEKENTEYGLRNGSSSSAHQFYSTIMSAGTLSDKISALTLSVQESPIHNIKALENLISLAKKRSRGQAVEVLGALKDLLGPGSLLPSDRKLKVFAAQPGLSSAFSGAHKTWSSGDPLPHPLKDVHLISWAYEDWLKTTYFEILKVIESWCNDEIVYARGKAVDYVYELLRDKPEQEANLLRLLINKLGDSDKKIASKTSYNIIQLETSHPLMKLTIINAIESDLLFRSGQSMHAKYYAVITLNQTVLGPEEEGVAKKLLEIYFALFVALLAKPKLPDPTVLPANAIVFNSKGERQGGGGAPGKRALQKLASKANSLTVDEEHREKMVSAVLTGVNRAMPFTKTDDESFDKHLDTIFRVTHSSNFNTSVQALMLIQQLCGSHQAASDRFYRTLYESLLDPRLLTSSKQAMYLNLLYRALKADLKLKRVEAFAKRLLQIVAMHQPPFACAVLYLLRELEAVFPNLQTFIDQPEEDESEDEEEFRDVDDHREVNQPLRALAMQAAKKQEPQVYDGRKREPEYSNADKSCLWEVDPFLLHYHPSVALFASRLVAHGVMPAKPDLSSHTLIHFLDRFVYRNPKKVTSGSRGSSIMQPLAGNNTSGLLVSAQNNTRLRQPVNTEAFWNMDDGKIDADEVFFHKYFSTMGKGRESAKQRKAAKQDVGEESDAEGNEDEIWEALVNSRPEIEGSDPSDNDLDMDDLESALESDEDDAFEGVMMDEAGNDNLDDDEGTEGGLDFDEDEEALLASDDEVPSDLDEAFQSELQFAAETAVDATGGEKSKQKRKRLKNLPTFASVEDYAAMLSGEDEEM